MRVLAGLLLAAWLAVPAASLAAPVATRTGTGVAASAETPRTGLAVPGTGHAVVRDAPGHASRVNPAKRQTAAQRRAALRKRIGALEARAAALVRELGTTADPAKRASLQVRLDACRAELLTARRMEARLRRGGR